MLQIAARTPQSVSYQAKTQQSHQTQHLSDLQGDHDDCINGVEDMDDDLDDDQDAVDLEEYHNGRP